MANHLKFCSCRSCRLGRHTKAGGKVIRAIIRKQRHDTKLALKQGREPERIHGVPYTD